MQTDTCLCLSVKVWDFKLSKKTYKVWSAMTLNIWRDVLRTSKGGKQFHWSDGHQRIVKLRYQTVWCLLKSGMVFRNVSVVSRKGKIFCVSTSMQHSGEVHFLFHLFVTVAKYSC